MILGRWTACKKAKLLHLPHRPNPTDKVPYSRYCEGCTEAWIESGKELCGHSGNEFQANAQSHHEEYEEVAVQIEKGEQRLLPFGEIEDSTGVSFDEVVEHQRKNNNNNDGNQGQPPYALGMVAGYLYHGLHASCEDFDAGPQPAQNLHQQQMFSVNGQYVVSVHRSW